MGQVRLALLMIFTTLAALVTWLVLVVAHLVTSVI